MENYFQNRLLDIAHRPGIEYKYRLFSKSLADYHPTTIDQFACTKWSEDFFVDMEVEHHA